MWKKMVSKSKLVLAFVVLFIVPPFLILPFRGTLMTIFPEPTLWQTGGMVLGGLVLFAIGVRWWQLRVRVQELESRVSGGVER